MLSRIDHPIKNLTPTTTSILTINQLIGTSAHLHIGTFIDFLLHF